MRVPMNRILLIFLVVVSAACWVACGGSSGGTINTVAGRNIGGFSGDGGNPLDATINTPGGAAVDSSGNLYIADSGNNRIRKVSSGTITTVAGSGLGGYSGDGGAATSAMLKQPASVALDSGGNLYIADQSNHVIRKVDTAGVITTVAGIGTPGFNGDNILATTAQLTLPGSIVVDSSGNLFISDSGNNRVREVVAATGLIQTVAGTGAPGSGGDSGPAASAQLSAPAGIALSGSDLYIADEGNNAIRKVSGGNITTVAGTKAAGNEGDNGDPTKATLTNPVGLVADTAGNFYFSDPVHNRVRKVSGGKITNSAGTGAAGYNGDGHSATATLLNGPQGLALDSSGNLYIADTRNHVIRKVNF
jgi:trimeric autotransporter adhesin